jgi:hypothetical protein
LFPESPLSPVFGQIPTVQGKEVFLLSFLITKGNRISLSHPSEIFDGETIIDLTKLTNPWVRFSDRFSFPGFTGDLRFLCSGNSGLAAIQTAGLLGHAYHLVVNDTSISVPPFRLALLGFAR